MSGVDISIVMPVFNTGEYLEQAIDSVLAQTAGAYGVMPTYELLVVDDHSTDPLTLDIYSRYASSANVRVLRNQRGKGAAGARNTGIVCANGEWIGFLDSDDWYLPHALSSRWEFILENPGAKWVAAHFYLCTAERGLQKDPLSTRSPTLYGLVKDDYESGLPTQLKTPVGLFAKYCAVGIHTVLLRRNLLVAKGMFDEDLPRAEDYQLWLKCAVDTDLWYVPQNIAVYRLRQGSLTRRDEPKYFHEHRMLEALLSRPEFTPHTDVLTRRIDYVLDDYCYFYRHQRRYRQAIGWAAIWLRKRPTNIGAWKQLMASLLRR